jgi:hypothetical protein
VKTEKMKNSRRRLKENTAFKLAKDAGRKNIQNV